MRSCAFAVYLGILLNHQMYTARSTLKKHLLKIAFWEEDGYLDHCTVV